MSVTVEDPPEFLGTARFELRGRLGEGGMGVVYRAHDHSRGALVALKTHEANWGRWWAPEYSTHITRRARRRRGLDDQEASRHAFPTASALALGPQTPTPNPSTQCPPCDRSPPPRTVPPVVTHADSAQSLLDAATATPDDDDLRVRAARALAAEGLHAESAALVAARWRNLTAHDPQHPGCLCRLCLAAAPGVLTLDNTGFSREFAVAGGRALWFWWPEGMEGRRARALADVTGQLAARFDAPSHTGDDQDEDEA